MSEWISVKELPPTGKCLVYSEKPLWGVRVFSASYSNTTIINGMFEWDFESIAGKVTHWMSLPKPPKE